MDRNRRGGRAIAADAADRQAAIDGTGADREGHRLATMDAVARKIDRRRDGTLARGQFVHTQNYSDPKPQTPEPVLAKKNSVRKPHRVMFLNMSPMGL
ncbi:hypothetical protein D9M68_883000 [compost metagenome]